MCFGSRARTGFLFAIYVCILLGIIPYDLLLVLLVLVLVLVHAAPTATAAASWRATASFPVALNWSPTYSYLSQRKFQYCCCCAFFQGSRQSSSGSTGFHCHTSSKISSAGSHSEHHWRCSYAFVAAPTAATYFSLMKSNSIFFFIVALKWSQHTVVLLKGSSSTAAVVHFFRVKSSSLPVDPLDLTHAPNPRFLVQGHILNIGGDALIVATSNCWQNKLNEIFRKLCRERVSYLEKERETLVRKKLLKPKTLSPTTYPPLFFPYKIIFFNLIEFPMTKKLFKIQYLPHTLGLKISKSFSLNPTP